MEYTEIWQSYWESNLISPILSRTGSPPLCWNKPTIMLSKIFCCLRKDCFGRLILSYCPRLLNAWLTYHLRSTEFITACKSQSVNIHRLRLNSDHHSRRTRRAPLTFITSHKVRERESVHYFTVTPSKLSNNVHVKFRPSGSIDVIFLNKDCTGVSVLKTSTCSIRHFMCFLVFLFLFM